MQFRCEKVVRFLLLIKRPKGCLWLRILFFCLIGNSGTKNHTQLMFTKNMCSAICWAMGWILEPLQKSMH